MKVSNFNPETLFAKVAWGIQHDAFEDPLSRVALRNYQHGICDNLVASILGERFELLKRKEALGKLTPFRIPRLYRGKIMLDSGRIRILPQWLVEHVLFAGNTGSGKSNLLTWILLQLSLLGCTIWVSENYKKQFRHLRRYLGRCGIDLIILRPQDWRWNLLQAEGDPHIHLATAVDILCRLLDEMPPRARITLRQAAHALYKQFGIFQGQKNLFPTLFDLYEKIRATPGLNEAAREAILDRLGSLLVSLTPQCAAYRLGWKATDLARYSIVFEMQGASELVKQVLLESALFYLFRSEVERGIVNGPLKLFVAFDDSQRFFNDTLTSEIAPMHELAGILRGTGIGLCIALQTTSGLSSKLIANLGTKIFGRLGTAEDYNVLGPTMGLNMEQREWSKSDLQPGMFIGQVSSGDWREAFLFHAPLLKIEIGVPDAEASDSVRALDGLPTVFASEFAHWEPHSFCEIKSAPHQHTTRLSEIELRFLSAVVKNPNKASSGYAKLAGINGRRAAEIRRSLVERGFIREHSVSLRSRGRTTIVLEPLEPAFKAVDQSEEGRV